MSIVITLDAELETLLRTKAEKQNQDINVVASELLAIALQWQEHHSTEAANGLHKYDDEFEAIADALADTLQQYADPTSSLSEQAVSRAGIYGEHP